MKFNDDSTKAVIEQIQKHLELAKRGKYKDQTVAELEEALSNIKECGTQVLKEYLNSLTIGGIVGVLPATRKADILVEEKYRQEVWRDLDNQTLESNVKQNNDQQCERCLGLRNKGLSWKAIAKIEYPKIMDHQVDKKANYLRATVNRYKREKVHQKNKNGTKRNI